VVRVWGGRRVVFYMGRGRRWSWAGPRAARLRLVLRRCACALGGGGGNGPPPGRPLERAVPVPCLGPGVRPKHGSLLRAVLARARWPPGRAGLGPGQKNGPRAGPTGSGCMANYTDHAATVRPGRTHRSINVKPGTYKAVFRWREKSMRKVTSHTVA